MDIYSFRLFEISRLTDLRTKAWSKKRRALYRRLVKNLVELVGIELQSERLVDGPIVASHGRSRITAYIDMYRECCQVTISSVSFCDPDGRPPQSSDPINAVAGFEIRVDGKKIEIDQMSGEVIYNEEKELSSSLRFRVIGDAGGAFVKRKVSHVIAPHSRSNEERSGAEKYLWPELPKMERVCNPLSAGCGTLRPLLIAIEVESKRDPHGMNRPHIDDFYHSAYSRCDSMRNLAVDSPSNGRIFEKHKYIYFGNIDAIRACAHADVSVHDCDVRCCVQRYFTEVRDARIPEMGCEFR